MPGYRSSSSNQSKFRERRSKSHDYYLRSKCDGIRCDDAVSLSPTNSYSSIRSSRSLSPVSSLSSLRSPRRRSAPPAPKRHLVPVRREQRRATLCEACHCQATRRCGHAVKLEKVKKILDDIRGPAEEYDEDEEEEHSETSDSTE